MENRRCSLFQKQAEELFNFYDRQRIGIITKKALLSYFRNIHILITEQWLAKMLITSGYYLPEYISCQQFVSILEILQSIEKQDDFYQFQS